MYRSTALTTTAGAPIRFPFDAIDYDTYSLCTTGASAGFTCPIAGLYRCSLNLHFSGVATEGRIYTTGGTPARGVTISDDTPIGSANLQAHGTADILANANDIISFNYFTAVAQPVQVASTQDTFVFIALAQQL